MPNPIDDILAHHGVKGQKWGVTRSRGSASSGPEKVTSTATPGKRVITSGGAKHPADKDAVDAAELKQKVKKSTTDALSNAELERLTRRMNLEQQFSNLVGKKVYKSAGQKFMSTALNDILKPAGKQATNMATGGLTGQMTKLLDAKKKK